VKPANTHDVAARKVISRRVDVSLLPAGLDKRLTTVHVKSVLRVIPTTCRSCVALKFAFLLVLIVVKVTTASVLGLAGL
jgi:hypothetical protein